LVFDLVGNWLGNKVTGSRENTEIIPAERHRDMEKPW
jgi:hypothetical protein